MAEILTVEQIDTAIAECLLYKRTTINDRTFEYQDIDQLRRLRAEVESRKRTSCFSVVQFGQRQ